MGIFQVMEGRRVFEDLSVEENLTAGGHTNKSRARMKEAMRMVYGYFPRLKTRKNVLAGYTSGGEQQMLVIGRGLMAAPKMMMLDEPSAALAPKIVLEIFGNISRISRETGMTILVVEQNVRMALLLASYGYVIRDGVVHIEGKAEDLIHDDNVRLAYLGGTVAEARPEPGQARQ